MSTPTFKRLSLSQFAQLLQQFPFTRRINAVHMHHTWRPNRAQFNGHETIVAMWRFHTQTTGWSDIAQHVTIDPEGFVWLGRDWNRAPASAAGHNGNSAFGPFMFEMIGDFDTGCDPFDGVQKDTALNVIARVQARFQLPTSSLLFHNAMSPKSCPGSALDHAQVLAEVDRCKEQLAAAAATASRSTTRAAAARGPFADEAGLVVAEAIAALGRAPLPVEEPADAELLHHEQAERAEPPGRAMRAASGEPAARDSGLDAATLAALRPHLVNLAAGHFSSEGEVTSSPADVDSIFEQHLPAALADAARRNQPLRIMFFAHGGLVSEAAGLRGAARQLDWWRQNDVYPIFFIWETGLLGTLGRILREAGAAAGAQRGLNRDLGDWFSDHVSDPVIERLARLGGGRLLWNGMKLAAERAVDAPAGSDAGGGARYVASKLKAFCDAHGKAAIELHAVGHSAGSIFHSHFLRAAQELKVPTFQSAQFLAPAIRVDTFNALLGARIGDQGAVRRLCVFTMAKDFERADHCASIYFKSLLYLVSNAFEDGRGDALLGLEESIRADATLKRLFGLDGAASPLGEVIWSKTASDTGRSASCATSHGDFDDDGPTMNSVLRRVLGRADADAIASYPLSRDPQSAARAWFDRIGPDTDAAAQGAATGFAPAPLQSAAGQWQPPATPSVAPVRPLPQPAPAAGRRRALCIGIDQYPNPAHRLAGCVADARSWSDALAKSGFSTTLLLDRDATRSAIDGGLRELIRTSRPGDVIVFQYSGHGTQVRDLNGDETDGYDEALCPVDFAAGALYIDDDLKEVLAAVPDGVNLTCFTDCCHSGSNTRFAGTLGPAGRGAAAADERPRYVVATPAIEAAHVAFRERMDSSPRAVAIGASRMREVKFAACQDREVAWESNGQGEFTVRAMQLLAAGTAGWSNQQFQEQLIGAFGPAARQHPLLDCDDQANARLLLQPLAPSRDGANALLPAGPSAAGTVDPALLAQTLASIEQLLVQLGAR